MSLSGRERAEGFTNAVAVAVAVIVAVTASFPSERAEGFTICRAVAVVADTVAVFRLSVFAVTPAVVPVLTRGVRSATTA